MGTSMLDTKHEAGGAADLSRIIMLSDGVFAIALTLLVLEIKVPGGIPPAELPRELAAMAPKVLIYLISFLVIGSAWDGHQRTLRQIKRADSTLTWLNLVMLLFVTILPATSALLGEYPDAAISAVCISLNGCLLNLMQWLIWRHATRQHQLVSVDLSLVIIKRINTLIAFTTITFGLAAVMALINVPLAYVMWIVALAGSYLYAARIGRRAMLSARH